MSEVENYCQVCKRVTTWEVVSQSDYQTLDDLGQAHSHPHLDAICTRCKTMAGIPLHDKK